MNKELEKYIPIIDFFSEVLGSMSEIVLHDIESQDLEASVIYIKNNLSGRELGSPATDFLVNILKKQVFKERNYLVNYKSKDFKGQEFLSSSYFLKNKDNDLIGMICVNTNCSLMKNIESKLEDTLSLFSVLTGRKADEDTQGLEQIDEKLYGNITNVIDDIIHQVTGNVQLDVKNFSRIQKIEIVRKLHETNFFDFKNSIPELANKFQMSEVSIYKYLQEVKNES